MPLVSQLTREEAPITIRNFFANGDPGPLISTFAHVPELMQKALPFISATLGPSSINLRTKELVILRASALQACSYCINTHTFVARQAGLSKEEIIALRNTQPPSLSCFSSKELALIKWTDAVALGPTPISAELKQEVVTFFSEAELVELTLLVGATVMLNRYATALDLPVDNEHLLFLQNEHLLYSA
jgi:AhpD family alkylhydroperoxidase